MKTEKQFKVGDVITAYHKGFHKITEIEQRGKTSPLIYYVSVADSNGKSRKGQMNACDALFCQHAKVTIQKEIELRKSQIESLEAFLKTL